MLSLFVISLCFDILVFHDLQPELFCDTSLYAAPSAKHPAFAQVDGLAVHKGADTVLEMVFVAWIVTAEDFERIDGLMTRPGESRLDVVGVFTLLLYILP